MLWTQNVASNETCFGVPVHKDYGSDIRGCIQKFPNRVDNEINSNNNNNKHSLRSNTKGYGGKTH
jgi:hypothetical protein